MFYVLVGIFLEDLFVMWGEELQWQDELEQDLFQVGLDEGGAFLVGVIRRIVYVLETVEQDLRSDVDLVTHLDQFQKEFQEVHGIVVLEVNGECSL